MLTHGRPGRDWTLVLRRRPGPRRRRPAEGGYTDVYELICCDCGDDPDLDYREISPELQRIRGPYPIAAGAEAYEKHAGRHKTRQPIHEAGADERSRRHEPQSVRGIGQARCLASRRSVSAALREMEPFARVLQLIDEP